VGDVPAVEQVEAADLAVSRIAASQRGVVTYEQLLAEGLSRGAIAHRLATGRLHRLHRGIYLVGHPVPPPLSLETAALLSCGDGAVLSHGSAAALWNFGAPGSMIDVTIPGRERGNFDGVRVHCVRVLSMTEVRRRQGLPLTSPARTLLDISEELSLEKLEQAVADARRSGFVRDGELEAQLERSPGRHGTKPLRTVLEREGGPAFTRSKAEQRLLALLRKARLPPPRCNVRISGHEVDFLWLDAKLVVEFDSWGFHRSRAAFEKDRRRDADLQLAGFRVIRITWRRLVEEPEAVVAQIARALGS
jgi:very-short-patch-repair endonuclease